MIRRLARCPVWLVVLLVSHSAQAFADGRTDYLLHCGGCHGLEGRGVPSVVPTLRDEPGRIERVPGGREYLLRVPGVAQSGLSDADLAVVMNYVLTEFSTAILASQFVPFAEAEVARYRADPLADPQQYRAKIWRRY